MILSFIGCRYINTPIEKNDIYALCAKGDTVNFKLFKKSQRIIKSNKKYFIWLDLYNDTNRFDQYALHLLVCDENLILKGASIAPNASITKVKGDTLYGWTIEEWKNEKPRNAYRNDLPPEIKFNIEDRKVKWNGYQVRNNTIIDSINFISDNFVVKMHIRYSKNLYAWPGRNEYFADTEYYSKLFNHFEVIEIPISSLYFSRSRKYISLFEDYETENQMHTLSNKIIENLYLDIWENIKKE